MALLFASSLSAAAANMDSLYAGGETLDYSLTWLYLTGGALRMTIGGDPSNQYRYRITSYAATTTRIYKVRDEIVSLVARDDFTTERYSKHFEEGGKKKDDVTTIDVPAHKTATRVRPKKRDQVFAVTRPIFDPISLVYHLRALDLKPGTTLKFPLISDGKVYTLEARVARSETISTPLGTFKTVVVEPRMQGGGLFSDEEGKLTIWFSDDERHLPVRIRTDLRVGSITAAIKAVRAGVDGVEPPLR
jgi:hypothetical protein